MEGSLVYMTMMLYIAWGADVKHACPTAVRGRAAPSEVSYFDGADFAAWNSPGARIRRNSRSA